MMIYEHKKIVVVLMGQLIKLLSLNLVKREREKIIIKITLVVFSVVLLMCFF